MNQRLAQAISNLFHPLLALTYVALILCLASPLTIMPFKFQAFFVGIVAFYTLVMPMLIILLMHYFHIVSHWTLRDRADRAVPLFANAICYAVCAVVLTRYGYFPVWVLMAYYGASVVAFVVWFISLWWKVSAHAAGNASAATYSFLLFLFFPDVTPLWIGFAYILVCGLVGTSRLYLGRHTLAQVGVGSLIGVVAIIASYFIFVFQ